MAMTQWLTVTETMEAFKISRAQLDNLRKAQVLKPGAHFMRKGNNPKSALLYDREAVDTALRQLAIDSAERWTDYDSEEG